MSFHEYTIEECCEILDNFRIPLNSEQRFEIKGEFPYYGANGVQGYISKYIFDDDLILIAEDGGNFEQFATRPIAYRVNGKCWVNNHAHILKAKETFSQGFIFYSLEHKDILYFIAGGTRSKLTQGELRKIVISHPEKNEADKIAQILSTADEAIEQTQRLIEKYNRIKRGLMQDLLTRGIDAGGNIRSKQTHKFTVKNGIEVPDDWEVVRLEEVAEIKRGKFTHRPRNEPRFYGGEFPFIQTGDISRCLGRTLNDFTQTLNDEGIKISKKFPKNTIVLTIAANIGDTALLGREMYLTDSVVGIIVNENQIPRFVEMWLRKNKEMLSATAPQSAQKNINLETLKPLPIPFVSFEEQIKIVNAYEAEIRVVEQLENNLSKLQAIKKGLMQDLLSGKKRVKCEE